MHFISFGLLLAACVVTAQRPMNVSVCDYYTTALLKDNTVENQYKVLNLLVNTAVIGNYTQPNKNAVPGILNPNGTFNGTAVNLVPYFSGMLASSNRGGSEGVSINFLDGGGATPLMNNKPANDTSSNQYKLLTHLYSYFGAVLNCSQYGHMGFPAYSGQSSQYKVHKFMDLNSAQIGYFIQQVGLSATSFGVSTDDAGAAGMALGKLFGYRCSPPTTVIPAQGPQLQSICTDESCPLDEKAMCKLEDDNGMAMKPNKSTSTMSSGAMMSSTASGTMKPSSTMSSSSSTGLAATIAAKPLAIMGSGILALLL